MTVSEIKSILKETGIPSFWITAPDKTKVPYITYRVSVSNFYADNKPLHPILGITINYYDIKRNDINESKIEEILNSHEISWNKNPEYDDTSKVFITVYESEVI